MPYLGQNYVKSKKKSDDSKTKKHSKLRFIIH